MHPTRPHIRLHRLTNPIILHSTPPNTLPTGQARRLRLRARNRHAHLQQHALHTRHSRPARIRQQFHAQRAACSYMPAAAGYEAEKSWADDTYEGWGDGVFIWEAEFENYGFETDLFEVCS
ncbi:hypothetical protein EMCG_00682 [[Emmonsia] crescens]|uniref:Uncharacterized protein n=1 Tax=[Emmonsia] crescens TaxID=73230 RepID=A0A0G2J765_9EURO|nr:hypothetical protein EMCG_00682 [Emmonsia crescens UAMH 3008]